MLCRSASQSRSRGTVVSNCTSVKTHHPQLCTIDLEWSDAGSALFDLTEFTKRLLKVTSALQPGHTRAYRVGEY